MNYAMRLWKFVSNTASILFQFAHGGLVITGLVVILLVGSRVGLGGFQHTQNELKSWVSTLWLMDNNGTQAVVLPTTTPLVTPDMRRVSEYLAHRYRVASPAVEPLVAAAHMVGGKVGLDPMLILAVVAIESNFNPFAESHKGAQGLMQVIPRYHQDILARQGDADNPLLDPITNIEVGAKVLKNSIVKAGNLKDGLQQYGGAADDNGSLYATKVLAIKQQLDLAKKNALGA